MKRFLIISATVFLSVFVLTACSGETDEEKAQHLLDGIETSISKGEYESALDSITKLRSEYPKVVKAREKALVLWQKASLLQAQHEVAVTDSALQATELQISQATTLLKQNLLRNKRDSLKARYDAECGVVRIIRQKQKEN